MRFKFGRKAWLVILFPLFLKCVPRETKQAERVKLTGLNGEAYYVLRKDDNTAAVMYKLEHNNSDYQILLYGDTILLGTDFKAMINVPKSQFRISVDSPFNQIMTKDSADSSVDYHFKPEREGIYDFSGTIEYDTVVTSFAFKFIVVKKE